MELTSFPGVALEDTFPMNLIAVIDSVVDSRLAFGDTDQDGLHEIVSEQDDFGLQLVIVEEQGNNTYTTSYPLGPASHLFPLVTGDLDQDNKREVVGQVGTALRIYESLDPSSHPSALIWETSVPNVLGSAVTGDTDKDGWLELIHSKNGFSGTSELVIYENSGDDSYLERTSIPLPGNVSSGEQVIADFDGDTWPEIAVCGNGGIVYVIEAVADNNWQQVWIDTTGMANAYAAEGGWDTDGNGYLEFFIAGNNFGNGTWDSRVYEATANNTYSLVATLAVPYNFAGIPEDGLGDLDGDGDGEYFFRTSVRRHIYDSISPGQWTEVGVVYGPPGADTMAYAYDLNQNGIWEIVWQGEETWVLEHPVPTNVGTTPFVQRHMMIHPNPVKTSARILWSAPPGVARFLTVFDVAGRRVMQQRVGSSPFTWSSASLPNGVYLLRLESGSQESLGSARAIVSR